MPLGQFESEEVALEVKGPTQVGDLEVDVADAGEGVDGSGQHGDGSAVARGPLGILVFRPYRKTHSVTFDRPRGSLASVAVLPNNRAPRNFESPKVARRERQCRSVRMEHAHVGSSRIHF